MFRLKLLIRLSLLVNCRVKLTGMPLGSTGSAGPVLKPSGSPGLLQADPSGLLCVDHIATFLCRQFCPSTRQIIRCCATCWWKISNVCQLCFRDLPHTCSCTYLKQTRALPVETLGSLNFIIIIITFIFMLIIYNIIVIIISFISFYVFTQLFIIYHK